jgi:hypothetical protein
MLSLEADSFAVMDGERVEDLFPSVDLTGHVFPVVSPRYRCEVQHFHGCADSRG